ncbi:protein FAM214A isoform X2 [Nymphalis io]|uniref:protein FAM214A isoform X2 n=1 Tax=Inachis io TaxID=171585 RepID=UPI0021681538|nr:protein FAM214A isoform X2 [Nymphalis io]
MSECDNPFKSKATADDDDMHSNEPPPATGTGLLLQLGRLVVRARSSSPAPRRHHINPSTSQQVITQPKPDTDEPKPAVEAQLNSHVQALWNDQIPICIEVLLAPDCQECYASLSRVEEEGMYDKLHTQQKALLLERWTIRTITSKSHETPSAITPHWLLNAVRSQLHFSQLSAWKAIIKKTDDKPAERRRKLSRETCNFKKIEANCDETDLEERKLNVVYSIKIPGESYKIADFPRPPNGHKFPVTDIGNNIYLKVVLESLPRLDDIPVVKCTCQKRRAREEVPNVHDELVGKLNDLTLGPRNTKYPSDANIGSNGRRISIIPNQGIEYVYSCLDKDKKIVDDRMLTPCSESGKHKCSCDDESDDKTHRTNSLNAQEKKKLDERRLKEIAKYKRRLRKESKLKKLCDSTSSEGDGLKAKETHTSIPILQAARFDRFRAIGCFRNQTYLTLPASRIESRSPFVETMSIPPAEFRRTNTVATQTEDMSCQCGNSLLMKCEGCLDRGMVRSQGNYNLASIESGARRKRDEDEKALKKHKCDNISDNSQCDISLDNSSDKCDGIIKRPKLRRYFPIVDRIEKVISDRFAQNNDIQELNLRDDDTVFSIPKPEPKRQKTFSISDDYVLYEKCDYGTIDKCQVESPKEELEQNGFKYPDPKKCGPDNQVPSPTEMDRFRWRFDSAASMVFHNKTGLPLTSSPAPLRRGNNCFDFDDSINGVSGIKSALFHPISPPPPAPASPASPAPGPPAPRAAPPRLRLGPSAGLLGSFEESALKGRLEPVATVQGFAAELGASGAFCPPHRRLPVTVFFYAPGGTNAPYMGHINLGPGGYRVARSGTVQVSLFNPHGTLVKMFVVLYDLTSMPPLARTFLRQRTLYMPAGADPPAPHHMHKWLRYLIHLRFMTSKSGKLYLHTDIRILVSRKADLDTATAHSALFRPLPTNQNKEDAVTSSPTNQNTERDRQNASDEQKTGLLTNRTPNRVFGGCSDFDTEMKNDMREFGYENQNGVSYELRSFTYAPENPKYSPR